MTSASASSLVVSFARPAGCPEGDSYGHRGPWWREFGHSTESALKDMLDKPSVFLEPEQSLRVSQMYMGSDGGFSFEGLGAIIEQLRLLIRDIKFENAHLEERGRLENIALRLRMQRVR